METVCYFFPPWSCSLFHCSVFFRQSREVAAVGGLARRRSALGPNRPTGRAGGGRAQIRRAADPREQRRDLRGAAQGEVHPHDTHTGWRS